MVFYMEQFPGDALSISDEEIRDDWRLGLVRAAGRVVADSALPNDSRGRFDSTVPGSNREHVQGSIGQRGCKLVAIYEVSEEKGERYNFSTFGDSTSDVVLLEAKADCACGLLKRHKVSMEVIPGELIYLVTNAQQD